MAKSLKQPSIFVVGEDPAPADTTPVVNNGKSELDASTPKDGKGWTQSENAGFLKNGYYNFDNALSSYGTWEIFSKTEAKTTLTVRFTNGGTTSRNMAVTVNGASAGTISFPSTDASWTTYSEAEVDVKLVAGVNTITFTSMTSDGGPNFDMFTFGIDGVELYDGTQKLEDPTRVMPAMAMRGVVYNPKSGVLFTPKAGFAEVYLYDMSGNMRLAVTTGVSAGANGVSLNSELLPKGMYVVKVKLDGKLVAATRMVK
jgi:hypothetical protein